MNDEEKKFQLSIVADRKGYFQQYIYSSLRKDYLKYEANTKRKALRLFRKDVDELRSMFEEELTPEEKQFLVDYELYCPVIDGTDTINRICHKVEAEFASYVTHQKEKTSFDPEILKSGVKYSKVYSTEIRKIYNEYKDRVSDYAIYTKKKRIDSYDANVQFSIMKEEFKRRCEEICPNNEMLCDIIVDLVYEKETGRQFAWDIVGDQIIRNLLAKNGNTISIPVLDEDGDVEFKGKRYRFERVPYVEHKETEYMEENYVRI